MAIIHKKEIVPLAKELRKNMTKEEKHLWYDFLKYHNVKVIRQKPIGNYIADFYCAEAKLVIELDGSQHFDNKLYDENRTLYFNQQGISVVRYWNKHINENFSGVCMDIDKKIEQRIKERQHKQ